MMAKAWQSVRHFSEKYPFAFLLAMSLLLNTLLYQRLGVKVVMDSMQYLQYADLIVEEGQWYRPHYIWYIGYVLFLVVCRLFTFSPLLPVLVQVVLHLLALRCLYLAAFRLSQSRLAAFISGGLFVLFAEVSQWNFYLLTESLSVSIFCFTAYLLTGFRNRPPQWLFLILVALYGFFIRPTGVLLLFSVGAFVAAYYRSYLAKRRFIAIAVAVGGFTGGIVLLNTMLTTFVLVEYYATGDLIYAASFEHPPGHPILKWIKLEPGELYLPDTEQAPLLRVVAFIIYNPTFSLKLFSGKLAYLLTDLRPYYSVRHNLYNALCLGFIYFFAYKGARHLRAMHPACWYLYSFMALHVVTVMFTVADWDGRFFMPLVPPLVLLAGVGFSDSFKKRGRKKMRFPGGN